MSPEISETGGTLVFLQGTGDPDPVPAETIRTMIAADPVLSRYTVLNVAWAAGGAPDVSVVPALPPRYQQAGAAPTLPAPAPAPAPAAAAPARREPGAGLALAGLDLLAAPMFPRPSDTPADGSGQGNAPRETGPEEDPAVAAAEENLLGSTLQRLALNVVTDVAVRRRVPLTEAASDFSRSIVYYLRRSAEARTVITHALRMVDQESPVILFGHSLGGVAAVDLVSSPQWQAEGLRLDLLVTAGSQSPWLYLLGGLTYPAPDGQGSVPVPWLNFWDERDLLSFCAERVFAGRGVRIMDREVTSGDPFPSSHLAYFGNPEVYRQIREELGAPRGE